MHYANYFNSNVRHNTNAHLYNNQPTAEKNVVFPFDSSVVPLEIFVNKDAFFPRAVASVNRTSNQLAPD